MTRVLCFKIEASQQATDSGSVLSGQTTRVLGTLQHPVALGISVHTFDPRLHIFPLKYGELKETKMGQSLKYLTSIQHQN